MIAWVRENAFTSDECEQIINNCGINDEVQEKIKSLVDMACDEKDWKFELMGLKDNRFHLYKEGDKAVLHKDTPPFPNYTSARKVSTTLQLTDGNEYEGGDLVIEDTTMPRTKGTLIAFRSNLDHEVTAIEKGKRNSLCVWFSGKTIE